MLREALATRGEADSSGDLSKRWVTDQKEVITECVGKFRFKFPAGIVSKSATDSVGTFFQNNNVILSDFTGYVYDQIMSAFEALGLTDKSLYLVDAYCGSGLFSVTCSKGFESVTGVEISADSVKYAIQNAKVNDIANASFITGSADKIFEVVNTPADYTALIIDPPRKVCSLLIEPDLEQGCDETFLKQLLVFNPRVVIYVSCNVHTQARDIGFLMNENQGRYQVCAIRGFDLFPQTHHVESIATLVRY